MLWARAATGFQGRPDVTCRTTNEDLVRAKQIARINGPVLLVFFVVMALAFVLESHDVFGWVFGLIMSANALAFAAWYTWWGYRPTAQWPVSRRRNSKGRTTRHEAEQELPE